MNLNKLLVTTEYNGERIDKLLTLFYKDLSRSYIQKLIKDEAVLVNGKVVKSNYKLNINDEITIDIPTVEDTVIKANNIPLDIVYEDSDVIIINKAKDMVVHPAAGHYEDTLVNALLYHCNGQLSNVNGDLRPGIVHRIDKDTTGLIIACKNNDSHLFIAEQLKNHSITRIYNAIVYNNVKDDEGTIKAPIGRHPIDRKKMSINSKNGKEAITHYKVIERLQNKYTFIECRLETGRTHQIRVHMSSINHPLLGDTVYGPSKDPFKLDGQALHARVIGFIHPTTKEYMEFNSPLPEYFDKLLNKLK